MNFLQYTVLLALVITGTAGFADSGTLFRLSALPLEIVTSEQNFLPFAKIVRDEVESCFASPASVDDPATLKILLSLRVHLAHCLGDNEKAVSTAAWIRSLQSDSVSRSYTGFTTLSAVEARRRHPGAKPGDAHYRKTFFHHFTLLLATLPRTREVVIMLQGQREKVAAVTEAALLSEVADDIAPAMGSLYHCNLAEADRLVRVRHRLVNTLPVRDEILQALDRAIASRS